MNYRCTIVKRHDSETWTLLFAPDTSDKTQKKWLRSIRGSKRNSEYGEVIQFTGEKIRKTFLRDSRYESSSSSSSTAASVTSSSSSTVASATSSSSSSSTAQSVTSSSSSSSSSSTAQSFSSASSNSSSS
jgi:hypothetical protein